MEERAFDDRLEGAGQPVEPRRNPFEDPSQRMAHRLLKNNGFAPAWILEGKDIDQEIRRLQARRETLPQAEHRHRVEMLNRRIAVYNLKVPVDSLQKPLLTGNPIG